jgi:pimeloyl-ACP methyl ester carboxylesterase
MCDDRLWHALLPLLPDFIDARIVPLHQAASRTQIRDMIAHYAGGDGHLLGFSMGGYLALEHALSQPENMRSLTLVAAQAGSLDEAELGKRQSTLAWLEQRPYSGLPAASLDKLLHPDHRHGPAANAILAMDQDLGKTVLMRQFRETSQRVDLSGQLASIRYPVLVVGGEQDQVAPPRAVQEMSRRIPHAQLRLLPDSGHMVPLEQPQRLADCLAAFYRDHVLQPENPA